MNKTLAALGMGLLVGLIAAAWAFTAGPLSPSSTPLAAPSTSPSSLFAPDELPEPTSSTQAPAAPGLVVHVVKAGRAVSGARVAVHLLTREGWVPAGLEATDAAGNASLPLRAGRVAVRVEALSLRQVQLADVARANDPTVVEVELGEPIIIRGRVLDQVTGAPLPGATVTWIPLDFRTKLPPEDHVTTRADGLGRYELLASHGADDDLLEARAADHATLEKGWSKETTVDLELTRGAVVAGVVVDEAGAPVANATVSSKPSLEASQLTDATGHFTLPLATDGATVHAVGPNGLQAVERLRLNEGERRELRLVLTRGQALEGFIHDGSGVPVANADVRVLAEPDDVELARLTSSAQGRFTAQAIPTGRYSILATAGEGARGRAVGYEHPTPEPADVRLLAAAAIAGRVTNDTGAPLASITVTLAGLPLSDHVGRVARTDLAGEFEFSGLVPGEVSIEASLGDTARFKTSVMAISGETQRVEIALGAVGTLTGRVESARDAGGPWQIIVGESRRIGAADYRTATDTEGHFSIKVPPGNYSVFATSQRSMRIMPQFVDVRTGEVTDVVLPITDEDLDPDAGWDARLNAMAEPGTGISFENALGGVRVSFLMQGCPAARAGVKMGDVVVTIDGEAPRDSLDAFARVKKPRGAQVALAVRRDGADQTFVVK